MSKGGKKPGGQPPTVRTVYTDEDETSDRWQWHRRPNQYTEEDKREIMAKVLECMIGATFRNHYYKWNNQLRRQAKGGAIGLRATGSLAKTTMDKWIPDSKGKIERARIWVWLLEKYVHDVLIVISLTFDVPFSKLWNVSLFLERYSHHWDIHVVEV